MSVVHVVPYFPPDRIGGVGEHVKVIHEGHLEMGVDSLIVTSGATTSDPRVQRVGKTPTGFAFNSWRRWRHATSCDVLHVHHGEGVLLALVARLRRTRPAILAMFHIDVRMRERASGPVVFEGRRFGPAGTRNLMRSLGGAVKALVDRILWMLADAVVVETNAVASEVSDLRPKRPVTVIPHGLGPSPNLEGRPEEVELLYVGTPGIRKRTHLLPSILVRVRDSVPAARLRIVGFGPDDDPNLRTEAERLGVVEAIEFVGPVLAEEVVPHYRAAQVLVLPSAYEGLPMVLLEAMREGLVPVATNVSGHPDAIEDGVSGYLFPVDSVGTAGDRCVQSLSAAAKAKKRMSLQAQKAIEERFSLLAELSAYRQLYEAAKEGRDGRSDQTLSDS